MRLFQCRCFWNMLPDNSVLSQSFKQAGWDVALPLDTNLNPVFNLQNPFFFAVAMGLLLEGRVALLNLPPLDATILAKLVQSQQRVKGYWIWMQSQSTASSVWAQADAQCLLRDAHRSVRPTCLDGAPWSQNNEIVSNHCSILSLVGICPHKFHSGVSPTVFLATLFLHFGWCVELGTTHGAGTVECASFRHFVTAWTELGAVPSQITLSALGISTNQWRCKKSGVSHPASAESGSSAHS